MQDDLQGLRLCCHTDELRDAPLQGFDSVTGSFQKLLVVTWRLNKDQQLLGEVGIWEGSGPQTHLSLCPGCGAPASLTFKKRKTVFLKLRLRWGFWSSFLFPGIMGLKM